MTHAEQIVEVLLGQEMTEQRAWDILISYCVGRRHGEGRFHTTDLVDALSWALNELKARGTMEPPVGLEPTVSSLQNSSCSR